jgi:hypothetical protein
MKNNKNTTGGVHPIPKFRRLATANSRFRLTTAGHHHRKIPKIQKNPKSNPNQFTQKSLFNQNFFFSNVHNFNFGFQTLNFNFHEIYLFFILHPGTTVNHDSWRWLAGGVERDLIILLFFSASFFCLVNLPILFFVFDEIGLSYVED